jgi:capsular polysaccharide transport system permease protein
MFESIKLQVRVIAALAIRDMQNENSKMEMGLAWAFVDVLVYVAFLSALRLVIKVFAPPGMPPFTFLVLGILLWQTFYRTYKGVETLLASRKKLLTLPVVTSLDVTLAKAVQLLCVYSIVFVTLSSLASFYEGVGMPRFPLGAILLFLSAWIMGTGFGLFMIPVQRMFPPARYLMQPLTRAMFWTSGLYFVITSVPPSVWPYLTWNPMLHVNELMRAYWFGTYHSPIASPAYIFCCVLGLVAMGLSMERFIRRVPA